MLSILNTCTPRYDILDGTFNPEIFTASISEVLRFYQNQGTDMHPMYTDAEQFFLEATYPTDGLKMVLQEVFARLAGNNTVPAIHRLETAFGGGKTHTLIACTHIGYKGMELASVVSDLLPTSDLPEKGSVAVVGIAGDELPVHKIKGDAIIPYTLWGEIAFQIGGESLYREVEDEAKSFAAPGRNYFDTVLGKKKVLIMLDELAQYTARLTAANPEGGEQLAAFLMGLNGYARSNSNISILLTLASATDAFASQTEQLAGLLAKVTGQKMSKDDALGIGQQAIGSISSVVSRDATAVVPVQSSEISRVLAKRLFSKIDDAAASQTASNYADLYQKNISLLPDNATRADFKDLMAAHYPFHPTLIDFLNNKLAVSENFQGTRGVLRVLSLAVRGIWNRKIDIPMIHTCHIDLRDARTVTEIIGRTGSGDLLPVLNADIGGADTEQIQGSSSNAQLADQKNPHPDGWQMYEFTWKTIFLNSLTGREQGLQSNIFGLTEQEAMFNVAFPGLTPSQINEALKEISQSAFYLRYNQGRYYASLDPSVNIALAKIRRTLGIDELNDVLDATARKLVKTDIKTFKVVHDVAVSEHIPDNTGKPVLSLVSLGASNLDVDECVTYAGPNVPRKEQNLVFLLVPKTVSIKSNHHKQGDLFISTEAQAQKELTRLRELARTVVAMRKLNSNPQNQGINPNKLDEDDFKTRFHERENALITSVSECYQYIWYPSANGQIACKEIKTGGGEGGESILEQIGKTLRSEGEIVTAEHTTQTDLSNLSKLFFGHKDVVSIKEVRNNFCQLRKWPILESANLLETIIRSGADKGIWYVYKMGDSESTTPSEFYGRGAKEMSLNINLADGYSLVTIKGANQRGWTEKGGLDPQKVKEYVKQIAGEKQIAQIQEIVDDFKAKHGDIQNGTIEKAITDVVQDGRFMASKDEVKDDETPELISGTAAMLYQPDAGDTIVTKAKASEKGWIQKKDHGINLTGQECTETVFPLMRRLGSIYERGGLSDIDTLDMTGLVLPNGGKLRVELIDATPDTLKDLSEFFEIMAGLVEKDNGTEFYLDISDPKEGCKFVNKLKKE
ncbi:AAA family ATPase [Desulfobacter hydrogenophilus]|uniref:AAA family ATPase n=1 Tax=Desulfobacter hydrogenophilus TaxID=2291 RepID=A0A328F9R3_9BACT|nr:DUF499 domain-containing protein [Desulfobacter hydrogenophilus]NDY73105.1 ATP-binding protein [Desulfobacter hydrogenophilus]QBH13548.1 ATP-binding protein [Desulfobacter hydrogenophilus]RAM01109.1 AAA family ATPase [Desulfobacter hydrogenophilus]